jgi:hypothetical protein
MTKLIITTMILCTLSVLSQVEHKKIPIPTLFNTGVDNNKQPIADGETDIHYTLAFSADVDYPGPDAKVVFSEGFPLGTWIYNDNSSKWIAPRADAGEFNSAGTYVYTLSFSLYGFKYQTAEIEGFWTTDNFGVDILINGKSTGSFTQYNAFANGFYPFKIAEGFKEGINNISFVVSNNEAPTGLRVIIKGEAVPIEFTEKE